MSTWSAEISLDKEFRHYKVFCTGESEPETFTEDDVIYYNFSHHSFVLPMSTFAIAIGNWTARAIENQHPRLRFIGPETSVDEKFQDVSNYVPLCLEVVQKLLGKEAIYVIYICRARGV